MLKELLQAEKKMTLTNNRKTYKSKNLIGKSTYIKGSRVITYISTMIKT